jgi:GT2 family glycosyltransferase
MHNPKVAVVTLVYHSMRFLPHVIPAMVNQVYENKEVIALICGNNDGGKEYIQENFPQVRVVDPGENLGFAKGFNWVFANIQADLYQLVNHDCILEPTFVAEMVKVFEDTSIGGANGKIFQYDFVNTYKLSTLDTTGIVMYKTGRARSRGQNEADLGQYDAHTELIGVDGSACMLSKAALEAIKMPREGGRTEYFDEDFFMYWEDVDLSLRVLNAGFKNVYVPTAIGYHGRTAASSPGGYKKLFSFLRHHNKIAPWIRRCNYKNHIFLFLKNSPKFYWKFFAREFFMLGFIVVFEVSTLGVLPLFFKQLPQMWGKRKWIQAHRKIDVAEIEKFFA